MTNKFRRTNNNAHLSNEQIRVSDSLSPKQDSPTSSLSKDQSKLKAKPGKQNGSTTRLTVKYDVGYGNQLYIRGRGADLSWEKGLPLTNTTSDEWVWDTDVPFSECEFKILINDQEYEKGENHLIVSGATVIYVPQFH